MNQPRATSFGDLLRSYRGAAGLTQEALAERARMSARAVSDLERGLRDRPRPETIQLLADALELPASERATFGAVVRRTRRSAEQTNQSPRPSGESLAAVTPRHNLPAPLTSFVGRQSEIADVQRILRTRRLVTLTGVGGCGKTRLALRVTEELVPAYPDGVWLIDLAPLTDSTLVAQRVGTSLGIRERPDRSSETMLTTYLRSKQTLLVLDNCEHLVDACAQLVEVLLSSCPGLQILATSRTALGIAGEGRYRVPPLPLPPESTLEPPDALRRFGAVELFVDRAQAVQPEFTLDDHNRAAVVAVCARVDGLPLAIELAAARVRVLTAEQIAARLTDRFGLLTGGSRTAARRQQTLRALVEWSHSLLSEAEQTLLRRLAVFVGGWTLEAAEGICAGSDVLDLLTSLVDKSLVEVEDRGEQMRYRLLETIRQFAEEKLDEAGEAPAIRARHRDWYLELAERAWPELTRRDQEFWFQTLDRERDNLRAALVWSKADEAGAQAELRLAGALGRYWNQRHFISEGREWSLHALARADRTPSQALAQTLNWAGRFAATTGDLKSSKRLAEEAVTVARAVGQPSLLSVALRHLALTEGHTLAEESRAQDYLASALVAAQQSGDPREIAYNLSMLGILSVREGDLGLNRRRLELALPLARESGEGLVITLTLLGLSVVEAAEGNLERARALAESALLASAEIEVGNHFSEPGWQAWLAMLTLWCGDMRMGTARVRAVLRHAKDFGEREAVFGEREAMVEGLLACVMLQMEKGNPTTVARLAGVLGSQTHASFLYRWGMCQARYDRALAEARSALGLEAFEAARAEGQAVSLEQAVDDALEESDA